MSTQKVYPDSFGKPAPAVVEEIDPWTRVESALSDHHHNPDLEAARVLYSAVAAHRLSGQPVWVMLVAPPGSMKTELLTALDGLPNVHLIDKITPNTFLSGQIDDPKNPRKAPASLLHRIGPDGIIVYPDFSTVLSMHREHKASVLSDMRRIYDGQLRKEFGIANPSEEPEWRGRLTFCVAATPDVDRHYSIFQTLGERFVMVRWHRPGGIEAALEAMNQDTEEAREDLKRAVQGLLNRLSKTEPKLSLELQRKIAALAEFVVHARTHVPRSGYSKEIIYLPEAEAPTRLAQQLAQLTKGSALLAGRREANEEDYELVKRAGLDCIPAMRRKVLDALIAGKDPRQLDLPGSTVHYALEDLELQGLVKKDDLSDWVYELLERAEVL